MAKVWEKDPLFDAYIEEHLEDPADHRDSTGLLTFEYFLKLYRAAMVWNRVKFAE